MSERTQDGTPWGKIVRWTAVLAIGGTIFVDEALDIPASSMMKKNPITWIVGAPAAWLEDVGHSFYEQYEKSKWVNYPNPGAPDGAGTPLPTELPQRAWKVGLAKKATDAAFL